MGSVVVGLNGFEVWAYVVELDDGVRMRLSLDDGRSSTSGWGGGFRSGFRAGRTCGCS